MMCCIGQCLMCVSKAMAGRLKGSLGCHTNTTTCSQPTIKADKSASFSLGLQPGHQQAAYGCDIGFSLVSSLVSRVPYAYVWLRG